MVKQHKALELASQCDPEDAFEVACSSELRRLHQQREDLLKALQKCQAWVESYGAPETKKMVRAAIERATNNTGANHGL